MLEQLQCGAGNGNRTRNLTLARLCFTTKLYLHIFNVLKICVLLIYTSYNNRFIHYCQVFISHLRNYLLQFTAKLNIFVSIVNILIFLSKTYLGSSYWYLTTNINISTIETFYITVNSNYYFILCSYKKKIPY